MQPSVGRVQRRGIERVKPVTPVIDYRQNRFLHDSLEQGGGVTSRKRA